MGANDRDESLDVRPERRGEGDAETAADAIRGSKADDLPALQERAGEALLPRTEHLLDLL